MNVSAGSDFALAVDSDGAVYAWGNGANGRLGTGTTTSSAVPVAVRATGVLAGRQVVQVSAGSDFAVALDTEGLAYAWGSQANGRLGNGRANVLNQPAPVAVTTSGALAGRRLTGVSAGTAHVLAAGRSRSRRRSVWTRPRIRIGCGAESRPCSSGELARLVPSRFRHPTAQVRAFAG